MKRGTMHGRKGRKKNIRKRGSVKIRKIGRNKNVWRKMNREKLVLKKKHNGKRKYA